MHLELFPEVPAAWRDDALAEKWRKVRTVRRVVTGALEIERAGKAHRLVAGGASDRARVGSRSCSRRCVDVDLAEICITSAATLVKDEGPADAFRLPEVAGVAVVPNLAEGTQMRALLENPHHRRRRSRNIPTSRRATPRRCANGKPCARRRSSIAR